MGQLQDPTVESLILDLLESLDERDRSYEEVIDAWRTSCPKLPVWEEANDRGLLIREIRDGHSIIKLSPSGRHALENSRLQRIRSTSKDVSFQI
jgi:D-3-phosphoglycerate dehydrogenase / 2-oxoglutarate reductase